MTDASIPTEPVVMVLARDIGACGFCYSGARVWSSRHGIQWQDFLGAGVSSTTLLALNDAFANSAVLAARERVAAPPVAPTSATTHLAHLKKDGHHVGSHLAARRAKVLAGLTAKAKSSGK
jgi:hypothetical protein